jgi:hypothetical protein
MSVVKPAAICSANQIVLERSIAFWPRGPTGRTVRAMR